MLSHFGVGCARGLLGVRKLWCESARRTRRDVSLEWLRAFEVWGVKGGGSEGRKTRGSEGLRISGSKGSEGRVRRPEIQMFRGLGGQRVRGSASKRGG